LGLSINILEFNENTKSWIYSFVGGLAPDSEIFYYFWVDIRKDLNSLIPEMANRILADVNNKVYVVDLNFRLSQQD